MHVCTVVCVTAMLSTINGQSDDDSEPYHQRGMNGYTYTSPSRNPPRLSTWSQANSWCVNHSSTLPIVRNSSVQLDIQQFIQTVIQPKQPAGNSIYLNAKKGSNNTEWRNVDGTISKYLFDIKYQLELFPLSVVGYFCSLLRKVERGYFPSLLCLCLLALNLSSFAYRTFFLTTLHCFSHFFS